MMSYWDHTQKDSMFPMLRSLNAMQNVDVGGGAISENDVRVGLNFGSKNTFKISIVFEDISRNSDFFQTEVKPYRREC